MKNILQFLYASFDFCVTVYAVSEYIMPVVKFLQLFLMSFADEHVSYPLSANI